MARRIEAHGIAGPVGSLEAVLEEPEDQVPVECALVCHPHPLYGGTMHNKVVYRLARALRRAGRVVLRFNFRGVGASEGEHADLIGEVEDARAALNWLRARYPELPFSLAGFSFGARVIAQVGCEEAGATGLVVAGLPVRLGAGKWLGVSAVPKTFVWSTHDQYASQAEATRLFATFAEPKQVIWIESPDHFFAGALDELEERVYTAVR